MKQVALLGLAALLMIAMPNCKKGGGGGSDACQGQAAVSATTSPAINSVQAPAPGPDFPLVITLTNVPTVGVSIQVKARPETPAGAAAFYDQTRATVTGTTDNWSITGTPAATSVIVDITITSKNCSTNKWTGSYRYSRK